MAKKKQVEEPVLTFTLPKTGLKKSSDNVRQINSPSFYISDTPVLNNRDKFRDVRLAICSLEKGKCLVVSNENTGITIWELKTKISNIVAGHKRKFIEKDFSTSKIDHITLSICRIK